jgi:WD40 repeat protein
MRRPAKIAEVAALAQVPDDQVIAVVEKFRKPGRSFLMPGMHVNLTANSVVELSHESFMRIWIRLSTWVDEEHESAQMYRRVSDAAAMYQIGKTSLWRPPDLQLALNWQKKQKPTRQWAQRYDIAFERAIVFLDTSRITYEAELKNQEMLQRRMLQRARITNIILALFLLIATGLFVYGFFQKIEADRQRLVAEAASGEAKTQRDEAVRLQGEAEAAKELVEAQNEKIQSQYNELEEKTIALRVAVQEAQTQRNYALRNLNESIVQRDSARLERDRAKTEYARAEKALEQSDSLYMLSVAQSLAAKSEGIDDSQLAGLTSMQGYLFHSKYQGKKYDPYIFRGLYYSLAKLNGYNYNAVKLPGGAKNRMYAIAVSSNSTSFYTTGSDGKIVKGDYLNPEIKSSTIFENKGFPNKVLALSKDEKYLVNGSDSSYIEIINLASPSKPKRVEGHTRFITDIKFLPDNSGFITTSADRTLRLTNQENGQSTKLLSLPYELKSIDISPNGKQLIGVSPAGKMVLVDLSNSTYKEIWTDESSIKLSDSTKSVKVANRILSVAWSPNSQLIAFGVEVLNEKRQPVRGLVKLYNIQTKSIKELTGHKSGIADLEFSPDGLLLASAGLDSKLQMWVVDHPEDLPIIMDNNNGSVWDVEFTKNSKYLIASCNNGEIRVWPTDPRMLAESVCPKMERNMTKDEWDSYVGKDIDYESTCQSLLFNKL